MATMNISLPDKMKEWVEAQTADGRYSNASDFVRDMIRREQEKAEKIAKLRELYLEGKASPSHVVDRSELLNSIKVKLGIANGMAAE